jgi:hypothetical protein
MSRHSFSRRIRRRRRTGGRLERLKIEQVGGLQMTPREHFMHVVDRYRNKVGRCSPGRRCPWDEEDWVFPPAGPPLRIHVPEDTFAADLERLDIALRDFYGPQAAASE